MTVGGNTAVANRMANAGRRLSQHFPYAFSQCLAEGSLYAKCIEANDVHNVRKDVCLQEFKRLKDCFQKALKNSPK